MLCWRLFLFAGQWNQKSGDCWEFHLKWKKNLCFPADHSGCWGATAFFSSKGVKGICLYGRGLSPILFAGERSALYRYCGVAVPTEFFAEKGKRLWRDFVVWWDIPFKYLQQKRMNMGLYCLLLSSCRQYSFTGNGPNEFFGEKGPLMSGGTGQWGLAVGQLADERADQREILHLTL